MQRLQRLDRWTRWVTLAALALATLTPSITHALRHLRGDAMPWSQLCSATGSRRIVFDAAAGDEGSAPRAHAFEHCAACALHLDAQAPPSPANAAALRADLAHADPVLMLYAPRPLPAWRLALSRAPPLQA